MTRKERAELAIQTLDAMKWEGVGCVINSLRSFYSGGRTYQYTPETLYAATEHAQQIEWTERRKELERVLNGSIDSAIPQGAAEFFPSGRVVSFYSNEQGLCFEFLPITREGLDDVNAYYGVTK